MRLPAMPVASGRRLTQSDIVVTLHDIISHRPDRVLLQDRPRHVAGYKPGRIGVLSLGDMSVDSMRSSVKQWDKGEKTFVLSGIAPVDETIDTFTLLVSAGAVSSQDGRVAGALRVPKDESHAAQAASLENMAALFPLLVKCVEDTEVHKAWVLTTEGTRRVEVLHGRVNAMPLFDLPLVLPKIADMTSYQLVLFLEEQCEFTWIAMPKRQGDRIAISFRPTDAMTPRFWATGRAVVNRYYLRALATTAAHPGGGIDEVQHGQTHGYYLSLLGLDKKNSRKAGLGRRRVRHACKAET